MAVVVCQAASFGRESGTTYMKDAIAPYVEKGELPGAVCILYNDGVAETTCIGYADVAAKRPITVNDLFAQCSQTKGFCDVSVAILVEEGKSDYQRRSSRCESDDDARRGSFRRFQRQNKKRRS